MDGHEFDRLTRMVGKGSSRRSILKGLLGLGGAAAVGTVAVDEADARRNRSSSPTTSPPCPGQVVCGSSCCDADQCTTNGESCCPPDTTPCSTNSSGCCALCTAPNPVQCGYDCCRTELQCCDNECCPENSGCLASVFPEGRFVQEETCCPLNLICGEQCCEGGTCFHPFPVEPARIGAFDRDCCPAGGTICAGDGTVLCCDGDTPDCCLRDGAALCIDRASGQCCDDGDCPGDPISCRDGVCDQATQTCDFSNQSNCGEGEYCCGGDNVCCPTQTHVCCESGCCIAPQPCDETGTAENCSACGDTCANCQECRLVDDGFQCVGIDTLCDDGLACTSIACNPRSQNADANGCVSTQLSDLTVCNYQGTDDGLCCGGACRSPGTVCCYQESDCDGLDNCGGEDGLIWNNYTCNILSGVCERNQQQCIDEDNSSCTTASCEDATGCSIDKIPDCCESDSDCPADACKGPNFVQFFCDASAHLCVENIYPCYISAIPNCTTKSCDPDIGCTSIPFADGTPCAGGVSDCDICQSGDCQVCDSTTSQCCAETKQCIPTNDQC